MGVKAPGFGDRRSNAQDIAILTNGTVISEEVGLDLKGYDRYAGPGKQVTVDKREYYNSRRRNTAEIKPYCFIKAQIEETTSDYDREKLQERLAKLAVE